MMETRERGLPALIAADIGKRIIAGELRPGDLLPTETFHMADLKVSRTTLREAIKILTAKGFVEAKPKIGTRVLPAANWNLLDPAVLAWQGHSADLDALAAELFEIRLAIEPMAAALAAVRATQEENGRIRASFERMAAPRLTRPEAVEADIAFHLEIIRAAHNRFFVPVASVIRAALTLSIPRTLERFGGLEYSLAMHGAIADEIARHDADAARLAVEKLIRDTYHRNFPASLHT